MGDAVRDRRKANTIVDVHLLASESVFCGTIGRKAKKLNGMRGIISFFGCLDFFKWCDSLSVVTASGHYGFHHSTLIVSTAQHIYSDFGLIRKICKCLADLWLF